MVAKRTARYRTRTHGDDNFWGRNRRIGLFQRQPHVARYRAGNQQAVGMSWRGHELDTKAAQVVCHCTEHVDIRFAPGATAGADLPELECSTENAMNVISKLARPGQATPSG